MFLLLLRALGAYYKVPTVFFYASTRMLLGALTALLMTLFLGPWFIRKLYVLKMGQPIRSDTSLLLARLHEKKKNTPTMGGILLLFCMLVSLVLWMDLTSVFTLVLAIATVWLGAIGGVDDYLKLKWKNVKGLSARAKMGLQTAFVVVFVLFLFWPPCVEMLTEKGFFVRPVAKEFVQEEGSVKVKTWSLQEYSRRYYVPCWKEPIVLLHGASVMLSLLLVWFTVVGTSNAVNLTDGLDGLAAGCLIMVSMVLGVIAFLSNNSELSRYLHILYIEQSGEIGIYLFALGGACLGFLWYNGHPAQVIMGDTGSLALGGIVGVAAVLLRREILLVLAGGIFVAEALSVILQVASYKFRDRRRIFLCAPLHHHFEYRGWPETKVVLRFWIVGFLLAIVSLATLKFQ